MPVELRHHPLLLISFALTACGPIALGDTEEDTEVKDADGDGFTGDDDCDDAGDAVNPDAAEACDDIDNNCDGATDEGGGAVQYQDADADGYGTRAFVSYACDALDGYVDNLNDCDDANPLAWEGNEEICDNADNNCDGGIDEAGGVTYYSDQDGDGYGDEASFAVACNDPGVGFVLVAGDCNDGEPLAWTGAAELCDGVDNDCVAGVDEGAVDATAQVVDADGDGFGSMIDTVLACAPAVDNTADCNDADATVNPDALETCEDSIDNDCDAFLDCGDDDCASASACDTQRWVFVASGAVAADFGGVAGGDAHCQAAADAVGLGGTYMAWLSDGIDSPATRFSASTVPYLGYDGSEIARDWADLVDGALTNGIALDESGLTVTWNNIWTGSDYTGGSATDNCLGWTSTAELELGVYAVPGDSSGTWGGDESLACDNTAYLVCFEQ